MEGGRIVFIDGKADKNGSIGKVQSFDDVRYLDDRCRVGIKVGTLG